MEYNFKTLMQQTAAEYKARTSVIPPLSIEARIRLEAEFQSQVRALRASASEEFAREVEREERRRRQEVMWAEARSEREEFSEFGGPVSDSVLREQAEILEGIRRMNIRHGKRPSLVVSVDRDDLDTPVFEQDSSSSRVRDTLDAQPSVVATGNTVGSAAMAYSVRSVSTTSSFSSSSGFSSSESSASSTCTSSATSGNTSPVTSAYASPSLSFAPPPAKLDLAIGIKTSVETAAERESRLRREKYERQQEEFRLRAEEITRRKEVERKEKDGWQVWNGDAAIQQPSFSSRSYKQPTLPSSAGSSRTQRDTGSLKKSIPPTPMTSEDVTNLVTFHDQQWTYMLSLPQLRWCDFPWPTLSFESPKDQSELTLSTIKTYVYAPLPSVLDSGIGGTAMEVYGQTSGSRADQDKAFLRDRLKDLLRRWHPDRFDARYLERVDDDREREMVKEGAGLVARYLNELLEGV